MVDIGSVKFNCGNCGQSLQWDNDLPDDQSVVCSHCGKQAGTVEDFKNRMRRDIAQLAKDISKRKS